MKVKALETTHYTTTGVIYPVIEEGHTFYKIGPTNIGASAYLYKNRFELVEVSNVPYNNLLDRR